jgi:hypothetical protein
MKEVLVTVLWFLALSLVVLGVAPPLVPHAGAQPAAMQGSYALDARASDDVNRVIEDVVKEMNFIRKPLARKRLRATTRPSESLRIAFTSADVTITTDGNSSVRTPMDGTPVEWTREDGEKFLVTTTHDGRTITRIFRAGDGQRSNAYSLSPDRSTLTMSIVLTSPQLPEPVAYKLVYKRQ